MPIFHNPIRGFVRRRAAGDKTPKLAEDLQAREAESATGTQDQDETRGDEYSRAVTWKPWSWDHWRSCLHLRQWS